MKFICLFCLVIYLCFASIYTCRAAEKSRPVANRDGVVLLHGIARTSASMQRMERFLQANGYRTLNVDYPSRKHTIEDIVEAIHPQLQEFNKTFSGTLHFVGYSMGGLVIRAYLHKYRPDNLGRVVMIGTPNKGSEVADFIRNIWLYRTFYGLAGQQLLTDQQTFSHVFGKVDYELGIIAGTSKLDPICSWIIKLPSDGKVSLESTKLEGMTDHIVIPAAHTFMPINKQIWHSALRFLQQGNFSLKADNSSN